MKKYLIVFSIILVIAAIAGAALTVTLTANVVPAYKLQGATNLCVVTATVADGDIYATNGISITKASLAAKCRISSTLIDYIFPLQMDAGAGFIPFYDNTNAKLKLFKNDPGHEYHLEYDNGATITGLSVPLGVYYISR